MKKCDGKNARNPTRNISQAMSQNTQNVNRKICKLLILAFKNLKKLIKILEENAKIMFSTCLLAFLIALFLLFFAFPILTYFAHLSIYQVQKSLEEAGLITMCRLKMPINAANRPSRPTSRNRPDQFRCGYGCVSLPLFAYSCKTRLVPFLNYQSISKCISKVLLSRAVPRAVAA